MRIHLGDKEKLRLYIQVVVVFAVGCLNYLPYPGVPEQLCKNNRGSSRECQPCATEQTKEFDGNTMDHCMAQPHTIIIEVSHN